MPWSLNVEQRALDKHRRDDTLLAVQNAQDSIHELGTGVSHRERRASGTVFCLDDFVFTKLNAMDQLFISLALDPLAMCTL